MFIKLYLHQRKKMNFSLLLCLFSTRTNGLFMRLYLFILKRVFAATFGGGCAPTGRSPVLTSNPLPELISGANCVSLAIGIRAARRRAGRQPSGRCQRGITNSGDGRSAATLYARRRILHSVFSGTMGRGVRVLKYEYEYADAVARLAESRACRAY